MATPSFPRFLRGLLALTLLAAPLGATWSIVVVNRRTGEVCVAAATCAQRIDLAALLPVIVVGRGVAAHQSVVDTSGANRLLTYQALMDGLSPREILDLIEASDSGFAGRQIGIVDFANPPVTFTGSLAGRARKGVARVVGELAYAIQGNVLAVTAVIDQCEAAFLGAEGDLGQRVLAGMLEAREFGGDGRCSCGMGMATACGSPPEEFEKSAHVGFMLIARIGDPDGFCMQMGGCANGDYYLDLNVKGGDATENDPDPIDQLAQRYVRWRALRAGRPDGILSRSIAVDSLPADGRTTRTVRVQLVDLDGRPLDHGGASVAVATADGLPPLAAIGPVADHGDGTYSFSLRSGTRTGTDRLAITARDALVRATLYPFLDVRSDPPASLHVGLDRISALEGAEVPFVVNEPARPRGKYWLLASLESGSGGKPGLDPTFMRSVVPAVSPFFPGPPGELDPEGRAEASYRVPAGVLAPLIGLRLEWRALILSKGPPLSTVTVGFEIDP